MKGKYHVVEQGECLSSIAHLYGFSNYGSIYDHPNNSELKTKRPNPNVLYPGDRLFVPEKDSKVVPVQTDKVHKFALATTTVLLRLVVKDEAGQPYANMRYRVRFNGADSVGRTDAQGKIEIRVPPYATHGELVIFQEETGEEPMARFSFNLGSLDPIDEITGIQSRLSNLGFECGPVDGIHGPQTQQALRAFQSENGLPATGEVDLGTRDKLRQRHDWL